jgi:hypothetical protein
MSLSISISIECTVLLPEFQAQQHMVRKHEKVAIPHIDEEK